MGKIVVSFALDTEEDRDLIRYLERQGNRSAVIREALRAHLRGGVTLADVYQAVKDLERKIKSGVVIANAADDDAPEEPPEAAAALEALARL